MQREIIYGFRKEVVADEDVRDHLHSIVEDVVLAQAETHLVVDEDTGISDFIGWANATFPIGLRAEDLKGMGRDAEAAAQIVSDRVRDAYDLKIKAEEPEALTSMERHIILQAIDTHWQEYLRGMDSLRQGIGLRAYGQRDPIVEYKKEAFDMFSDLMDLIKNDIVHKMFMATTNVAALESFFASLPQMNVHDDVRALGQGANEIPNDAEIAMRAAMRPKAEPKRREDPKVGRNDPCPCGSGKKYKKCCGSS